MLLFYPSFSHENQTEVTGVKSKTPSCCFTNPDMLNFLLHICVYIYILDSYRFVIFLYIHKSTVIALTHWRALCRHLGTLGSTTMPLSQWEASTFHTFPICNCLLHLWWVWEDYKACVIQGLLTLVLLTGWWFEICIFSSLFREMIQFGYIIFFRWVGTTNKLLVAFDVRCRSPETRESFRPSVPPLRNFYELPPSKVLLKDGVLHLMVSWSHRRRNIILRPNPKILTG